MGNHIWYHGTNEEGYNTIISSGYFKAGTYFTPYFDSAICMGGGYVFAILREAEPSTSCWEWISDEVISTEGVHSIRKVGIELLHYNKKIQHQLLHENEETCHVCDGYGELTYPDDGHHLLPGGSSFNTPREIVVCPYCEGYGNRDKRNEMRKGLVNGV